MSDDLVKRLRDHIAVYLDDRGHIFEDEALCEDAADRIEELTNCVAVLEALLAKAVEERDEALNQLDSTRHSVSVLEKRIAELTGGKDA